MAVAMALLGVGQAATAATFTVDRLADDTDPGSLRWAVQSANDSADSANTIEFAEGLDGFIELNSPLTIENNALTIEGPGPDQITVEQNGLVFLIEGSAAAVVVNGMTLRHPVGTGGISERVITNFSRDLTLDQVVLASNGISAPAAGNGGCLLNDQTASTTGPRSLTVRNSVFDRCETASSGTVPQQNNGGAIFSDQVAAYGSTSSVLIEDSTFTTNFTYGDGGAVAIRQNRPFSSAPTTQSVTIVGSELSNNSAYGGGGGLWLNQVADSTAVIEDTVFDGNSTVSYGGAIDGRQGEDSSLLMSEVTLSENTATDAGAVRFYGDENSNIRIEDSLITGNNTFFGSNGLRIDLLEDNMSLEIIRTTLSNNTGGQPGVLFSQMAAGQNRALSIVDSTISGNEADQILTITSFSDASSDDQVEIINSTITGNTAESDNGVFISGSSGNPEVLILHTTVADNLLEFSGFQPAAVNLPNVTALVRNSIFSNDFDDGLGPDGTGEPVDSDDDAGNSRGIVAQPRDLAGTDFGLRHSLVRTPGSPGGLDDLGGNIFEENPELQALADNGGPTQTMAIDESSVVFDAGDSNLDGLPAFDQRGDGFARVSAAAPDMGAFELQFTPAVSLSTDDLDFPDTRVNSSAEALSLTVDNTGNADLMIDQISILGENDSGSAFSISEETCTAAPVTAGEQCVVSVIFTPDDRDSFDDELIIESNAPSSPDSADLSGTGIAPLVALGDDLDFGSIDVGTSAGPDSVTLSNPGDDTLEVTGFSGIDAPFTLDFGDCGSSLPFTLSAGENCNLDITFSPTTADPFSQTVSVDSDAFAGENTFNVSGNGIEPELSVPPLSFSDLRVGQTQNESITLTNTGQGTLAIDDVFLADNAGGVFGLVEENCTTASLPSGESCQLTVSFSPDDRADFNGALQVDSNAPSSPTNAALSGTGIAPLIALGDDLDFGSVDVDTTAGPDFVNLSNPGDDVLEVAGFVDIDTPFALDFGDCGSSLPFTLPAGESCNLAITFSPETADSFSQTVNVASDAFAGEASFNVSGTGVQPGISVPPLVFNDLRVGQTQNETITLTNSGLGTLAIDDLFLADNAGGVFGLVDENCTTASLPSGESCQVTVSFTPDDRTDFNGALQVNSNAPSSPTSSPLSGTGIAPLIVLGDDLDFGSVDVDTTAGPDVVALSNPGDDVLEVTGFTGIDAPFALDFSDCGSTLPFTLPAGESCNLAITFSPETADSFSQTVNVASDAFAGETSFNVSGTGVEPGISVPPLAFNDLRVGQTQNESITLTNTGQGTLTIDDVFLADNAGGVFGLVDENCTTASLPSGESCQVTVSFSPDNRADFNGALQVNSNAPSSPTNAALSGTGIAPLIALGDDLDFGSVDVDTTAGPDFVALTNPGDDVLEVTGFSDIDAPFALDFSDCGLSLPFTLPAGESCNLAITFSPETADSFSQTVNVASDAFAGETSFNVSGAGVQPGISVPPLAFADLRVGQTQNESITVSNNGQGALQISDVVLADDGSGIFGLVEENCTTASLPSGESCQVTVSFSPDDRADFEGAVQIESNAPSSPTSSALSGTGIAPLMALGDDLDFGSVDVGTSAGPNLVPLSNPGDDELEVTAFSDIDAPFALDFSDCGSSLPFNLSVDETCNLAITFSPESADGFSQTVTVSSDAFGGDAAFNLSGDGIEPGLSVQALEFDDLRVGQSQDESIAVTNNGQGTLEIDDILLADDANAIFGLVDETCTSASLASGESCQVTISFNPDDRTEFSGALQIDSNAPSSPSIAALSGTGIAPLIALGDDLDFGSVDVDTTAGPDVVALTNPGDDVLEVTGFSDIDAPFALDFSDCGSSLPFNLPANESCDLAITFSPESADGFSQTVTVSSDAFGGDAAFSLSGDGIEPGLSVQPLSFDELRVGQTRSEAVVVTNTGQGELDIDSVSLNDDLNGVFAIEEDSCTSSTLSSDENCEILISFGPNDREEFTASLQIDSNAPSSPASTAISGTGIAPVIEVGESIDFGEVEVDQSATPQTITLANVGDDELEVIDLTGIAAPFTLDFDDCGSELPFHLPAGESCTLEAGFLPTEAATATQTISITSDAFSGDDSFSLSGEGVIAELQVEPLSILFSDEARDNGQARSVTITNVGRAALEITSIGSLETPFQLDAGTCPSSVPFSLEQQGESCELTVSVEPIEFGDFEDSFTVISANGGSATVDVQILAGAEPAPQPIPVPTLSRVTALLAAMLLGLFGWFSLRRRQDSETPRA